MFKYTCLNPIADVGLNNLTDEYTKTDDFAEADAVLVRSAAMHDMELSDNLCAVARAGAGVNNIPLDKCADKGIVVFNTPGANANGVKELFVTGMLLAARDVVGGIEWAKENADNENISKDMEKAKKQFAGTELMGKKIGVIGLGAIGVLVANVANRMKMDVYGVDPFLSVNNALSLSRDVKIVKSYEEIYKNCDYITIHVPLLEDTKGMLNKEAFDKMKDGVVILNMARDTLVNDDDMKAALESGKVAKYVTDGNIVNSVNYPYCDAGVCDTKGRITVCHKNVPAMLNRITNVFSEANINIAHMTNKSRGNYAYCIFDIDSESSADVADKLSAVDGVLKVRIIK